ncbi:MAG: FAD/NAD(P)-binding protein [Pseudomonadota bacterium]
MPVNTGSGSSAAAANGNQRPRTVGIVGAGFSGMATAINLLQNQIANDDRGIAQPRLDLTLYEQDDRQFGGGLAYSDLNGPEHFTNIPAFLLSVLDNDPDHFTTWLQEMKASNWQLNNGEQVPEALRGDYYAVDTIPRALYGRYLRDTFDRVREAAENRGLARYHRVSERVIGMLPHANGDIIHSTGQIRDFDHAILATGHIEFRRLPALQNISDRIDHRVVDDHRSDPTETQAILSGRRGHRVTIIGTGLSADDHVLTALKNGFFDNPFARMTLISRSGRRHPSMPRGPFRTPPINYHELPPPPRDIREIPDYVTGLYDRYRADGYNDWEISAGLRPHATRLARESGISPRRLGRLLRDHASTIGTTIIGVGERTASKVEKLIAEGRVRIVPGTVHGIAPTWRNRVQLEYTPAGTDQPRRLNSDALIVASGPDNNYRRTQHPVYRDLGSRGQMQVHEATGIGITVDSVTRAVRTSAGFLLNRLQAVGPMTAGQTAIEEGLLGPFSQNVPTLRRHAALAADAIVPNPVLVLRNRVDADSQAAPQQTARRHSLTQRVRNFVRAAAQGSPSIEPSTDPSIEPSTGPGGTAPAESQIGPQVGLLTRLRSGPLAQRPGPTGSGPTISAQPTVPRPDVPPTPRAARRPGAN